MLIQSETVVGIAVGVAVASVLLTACVFLLLRRHEAVVAAKKEASMAPIIREKMDANFYMRRHWLSDFHEENLVTSEGYHDELWYIYGGRYAYFDGGGFNDLLCIDEGTPPQFDSVTENGIDAAPHDISAALLRYFENELDLGIDHRIITRMLFDMGHQRRDEAIGFLFNKAFLSFCNFGDYSKYTILPRKIMELAEEINARGFNELDHLEDRGHREELENRFPTLFMRWRVLTCKLYGRDTMSPELKVELDRRIDFLITILKPILKPETMSETRETLTDKLMASLKMALYCVGQPGLIVNSWDVIGPGSKTLYVGEPEPIPPFDMMAEKTLVLCPAWLVTAHVLHGMPFVHPSVVQPAKVIKFTDGEWAQLTEGLEF